MDVATGWSIYRLGQSGYGAVIGGANPLVFAISATLLLKKWVDSENAKLLQLVQQRESCPHIQMLEGYPPTIAAHNYVRENEGVTWTIGDKSSYWFWHPDVSFRPLTFSWAMVAQPGGGAKLVRSQAEFVEHVAPPKDGYGCGRCKEANRKR